MGEMVFGVNIGVLKCKETRRLLRNIARREMDCISSMKYGYIYAEHDQAVGEWKYLEIDGMDEKESKKAKEKCLFFESPSALMWLIDDYDLLDVALEDLDSINEQEKEKARAKKKSFLTRIARILKLVD